MRARLSLFALCAVLAVAYSCNCGPGTGGTGGGSGGGSSVGGGSATGGGSSSGGGGGTTACVPACTAPQFCSVAGHCLDAGRCGGNDDCAMGNICAVDGGVCVPGSSCGSTAVNGGNVAPNLIIALDRSCSMTSKVGTKTKWEIAVEAINQLTTTYKGQARFGLTLFPDTLTPNCGQGAIPIPIGPNNETAIQARLLADLDAGNLEYPKGPCVTNIDTGIQQAASDPALSDPTRRGYVLLITDGAQSGCTMGGGNNGTELAIHNLRTQKNVDTFVVGFDNAGGIDIPSLNRFADAGGQLAPTALDGGYLFFNAQDQASLQAVLNLIGGRTLGCDYALTMAPPDSSKLFVFFDAAQIARDGTHMSGWDYDATRNQVTFYGAACTKLKAGQVTKLDIVYGCPGIN
jgi:hypothetical protein